MTNSLRNFIIGSILILIGIVVLNIWLNQQIPTEKNETSKVEVKMAQTINHQKIKKEILRQSSLHPNGLFSENVITVDGQEVARFKFKEDEIVDLEGQIPDGEIKFIEMPKNIQGVEHYRNGQRQGSYVEYESNGGIQKEIIYSQGKIRQIKEFFSDGILRMSVDYDDALHVSEHNEVGQGKVYNRDGSLMYEWNLRNLDENRYRKFYNPDGKLREAQYFDINGKVIKTEKSP